jgi:hypothetical protein
MSLSQNVRAGAKNVKDSAITIGNLFVYIMFADETAPDIKLNVNVPGAVQLWPIVQDAIAWPPAAHINEAQARYVAQSLGRMAEDIGRRRRGLVFSPIPFASRSPIR